MNLKFIKKKATINRKIIFVLTIFWALFISFLNWNNKLMLNLIPYYLDFADLFRNNLNFNLAEFIQNRPTFPMWGYGFLLNYIDSKFLIVALQLVLFLLIVLFSLSLRIQKVFGINKSWIPIILLCIPSFIGIFSTVSSYPIAIFCLTISIILFGVSVDKFFANNKSKESNFVFKRCFVMIILSGLSAGITMNFRSDYTLFFISMPFISSLFYLKWQNFRIQFKKSFFKFLILIIGFYLSLFTLITPWMNYTSANFNKRLLTSSNTGHVFFIGLGQLPNNKWGITTKDADPVKSEILLKNGIEDSLSIEGDNLLKKEFFKLITQSPVEYFKKISLGIIRVTLGGIYIPEFFEISLCDIKDSHNWRISSFVDTVSNSKCREIAKSIARGKFQDLFTFNFAYILRLCLTAISFFSSTLVVLFGLFLLPKFIYKAWRMRSFVLIFTGLAILYQCLIGIFAFHMPLYMTNVYIFLVIVISNIISNKFKKVFDKSTLNVSP